MRDDTLEGDGTLRLFVNHCATAVRSDSSTPLLYVLRNELGLTGTKAGCTQGECGSCTVHLGGRAVKSCQTAIADVGDEPITTIEGLMSDDGGVHAVQRAFLDHQAGQCAFCIPGLIMETAALQKCGPIDDDTLFSALDEHICRCGTHVRILAAIRSVISDGARRE